MREQILGIRVNAINPASVRTSFREIAFGMTPEEADESYGKAKSLYLLARVGEVADTTAAITFLADDKTASFMTGVLLPVDGGMLTGQA